MKGVTAAEDPGPKPDASMDPLLAVVTFVLLLMLPLHFML